MATLLSLVQDVLSDLVSDEVDSISDSTEATTVATLFKTVYEEMTSSMDFPEHEGLFNLTETDTSTPVLMTRPSEAKTVEWVRYDKQTLINEDIQYVRVPFVTIKEFLDTVYSYTESDDGVESFQHTVGASTFNILYRTDRHPDIYTTFDDETLVFNGHDVTVDSYLRSSKTLCFGQLAPTFLLTDEYEIDLDPQHIPLLRATVAQRAFDLLKDRIPVTTARAARNLKVSAQRTARAIEYGTPSDDTPHYGRKM